MIGATPPKFTYSGCTTPSDMPAATPASIALPPASRILKPASAARYWQAATMWRVPMMVGRWAFIFFLRGAAAFEPARVRRLWACESRVSCGTLRQVFDHWQSLAWRHSGLASPSRLGPTSGCAPELRRIGWSDHHEKPQPTNR